MVGEGGHILEILIYSLLRFRILSGCLARAAFLQLIFWSSHENEI